MAKKSSTNAVKKIDKQIEQIKKKRVKEEKESVPIINKEELELIEKATTKKSSKKVSSDSTNKSKNSNTKRISTGKSTSKKNSNKNKSSSKKDDSLNKATKKNIDKKEQEKTSEKKKSIKTGKKNKIEEPSYETMRLKDLEKEMRSLYDKVNDNFSKDYEKTSEIDIVIENLATNAVLKEESKVKEKMPILTKVMLGLFITFMILFIAMICFIIFITTF